MSEELLQTVPCSLDRYVYWKLGSTTLTQLKNAKILPLRQIPAGLGSKKPDGLIAAPNAAIKAVIEYKTSEQLSTRIKIQRAILQELDVAKLLCKVLIVSDGDKSIWVNTLTGNAITDANGDDLRTFSAKKILEGQLTAEEIQELENLLDQIEHSLTASNDTLVAPELVDPSMLAKTIWQKIWINTGKNPEQCLYNVVELFVFKFLSDVGVLEPHNNFDHVYTLKSSASARDALEHYANISRKKIKDMFPLGDDGTTVINGTIFVNEKGQPNLAQARLFGEVLDHLQDYSEKNGSFRNIQREFKTRLYESFLRQEAGVKSLGQYFTPRNVVRAMVEMSSARSLQPGARICDPFCGVGGFILETIAGNPQIYGEFEPRNGIVSPKFFIRGYDKGTDEKEDERTIILAKANMLIYFSDLLSKYNSPANLKAFSEHAFNSVFQLLRSNLGVFARIDEPYDLILTNPPYVTSGSQSLKLEIEEEALSNRYTAGGRGTESLAIEWVIRHLKANGEALIIVPDGLLNQSTILEFVKRHCVVSAIISLPSRTFYSTPKKTYILVIERKAKQTVAQSEPVFTYIVGEIGESRDAKRWKIDKNDLNEAVVMFNQFRAGPGSFKSNSPRCKIVSFEQFDKLSHWMVDRYWDQGEKQQLGMEEEIVEINEDEFYTLVDQTRKMLEQYERAEVRDPSAVVTANEKFVDVELGDKKYFTTLIGQRVLKKDIDESGIPVYSSNVLKSFGFVKDSIVSDFTAPSILWGIDGNFDWNLIPAGNRFMPTDHCGVLRVLDSGILPEYLYYALRATRNRYGFDRTFRASLANIGKVIVPIPVKDGRFDKDAQLRLAERYKRLAMAQSNIAAALEQIVGASIAH